MGSSFFFAARKRNGSPRFFRLAGSALFGHFAVGAFPCKRKPGIIIITGAGKTVEQGSVNKVRHFCEFPARTAGKTKMPQIILFF
jgi:hypothetical protein